VFGAVIIAVEDHVVAGVTEEPQASPVTGREHLPATVIVPFAVRGLPRSGPE